MAEARAVARQRSSETLRRYLQEISRIPGIDADREKVLGARAQVGDREAMRELVEANLRFVVSFAKRYRGCGLSFLDLINEGNLGLMEAAKRFDPEKDVRFLTYAVWWVRQSIVHAISEQGGAVRLPQKQANLVHRLGKAIRQLNHELEREPEMAEIASHMNLPVTEIDRLLQVAGDQVSLSTHLDDDESEGRSLAERLEQDVIPPAEEIVFREAVETQLRSCVDELDPKEELVVKMRFGLEEQEPRTLKEIGEMLGLSRERIRQIETQALKKLRRMHRCKKLRGYLN